MLELLWLQISHQSRYAVKVIFPILSRFRHLDFLKDGEFRKRLKIFRGGAKCAAIGNTPPPRGYSANKAVYDFYL